MILRKQFITTGVTSCKMFSEYWNLCFNIDYRTNEWKTMFAFYWFFIKINHFKFKYNKRLPWFLFYQLNSKIWWVSYFYSTYVEFFILIPFRCVSTTLVYHHHIFYAYEIWQSSLLVWTTCWNTFSSHCFNNSNA